MQKLQASEGVFCAYPCSFECCVSLCDADYICPRCVLLAAFFWPSQGQWCFFLLLQNGIIWQLFLLHRADYRGQLFMLPDQVHIKHRLFVSLILIWRNNTFILLNLAETLHGCSGLHKLKPHKNPFFLMNSPPKI